MSISPTRTRRGLLFSVKHGENIDVKSWEESLSLLPTVDAVIIISARDVAWETGLRHLLLWFLDDDLLSLATFEAGSEMLSKRPFQG